MIISNKPVPHFPAFDDWIEGSTVSGRFVREDGKTLSVREDGSYGWTPDPAHPDWGTDGAYETHVRDGHRLVYKSGGKSFVIITVG